MNIKHAGQVNGRHQFNILADGNRPVLEIFVDESADEGAKLPIFVKGVGKGLDDLQATKGLTHAAVKVDESGVQVWICANCIVRYVLPRIVTLMARVYLPIDQIVLDPAILED